MVSLLQTDWFVVGRFIARSDDVLIFLESISGKIKYFQKRCVQIPIELLNSLLKQGLFLT